MRREFTPAPSDIERAGAIAERADFHTKIFYYLAIGDFEKANSAFQRCSFVRHLRPLFLRQNRKYLQTIRQILVSDDVFDLVRNREGMTGYSMVEDKYRRVIAKLRRQRLPTEINSALQEALHYEYQILIDLNADLRGIERPKIKPGPASFHI